jgi:transposase
MSIHLPVCLTDEQRKELETFVKAGNAPARVQTRARILLLGDRNSGEARTDEQIAQVLLCSHDTVANVRRRFIKEGLQEALFDKPRPGRAPKITGDVEAQIAVIACSKPPEGYARWTVRLITARVIELGLLDSVDPSTIWDRLKKTRSSPGK